MLENLSQNVQVKISFSLRGNIFISSFLSVDFLYFFASLGMSTYCPYILMLFIQILPCTQVLNSEIIIHL